MQSEVDLVAAYRRLMAGWLWIVAAAVVGGLLGLLAATLRPPLYEATAVLAIGIDRNRADVPDDITLRQAFDRVRGLLLEDDTLEAVSSGAGALPAAPDSDGKLAELRDRVRLSERPDGWVLAVTGADRVEAERRAQAWAAVAVERLKAASEHALLAAQWQQVLFEASCWPVPDASGAMRWLCRSAEPEGQTDTVPAAILAEVEASRGILPVLTYSLLRGAEGSARPILWNRGSLVLAGSLIGMVVAGLAIASGLRPRLRRRADGPPTA